MAAASRFPIPGTACTARSTSCSAGCTSAAYRCSCCVVLFLAGFALTGFALNHGRASLHRCLGAAARLRAAAFFATLPIVRILGAGLARLIPQDQTYAVSFDSLVGRVATIVSGTARPGYPAQARVPNEHGQTLYVMVEPDAEGMTFRERRARAAHEADRGQPLRRRGESLAGPDLIATDVPQRYWRHVGCGRHPLTDGQPDSGRASRFSRCW